MSTPFVPTCHLSPLGNFYVRVLPYSRMHPGLRSKATRILKLYTVISFIFPDLLLPISDQTKEHFGMKDGSSTVQVHILVLHQRNGVEATADDHFHAVMQNLLGRRGHGHQA